jgi:hypothetical protein
MLLQTIQLTDVCVCVCVGTTVYERVAFALVGGGDTIPENFFTPHCTTHIYDPLIFFLEKALPCCLLLASLASEDYSRILLPANCCADGQSLLPVPFVIIKFSDTIAAAAASLFTLSVLSGKKQANRQVIGSFRSTVAGHGPLILSEIFALGSPE